MVRPPASVPVSQVVAADGQLPRPSRTLPMVDEASGPQTSMPSWFTSTMGPSPLRMRAVTCASARDSTAHDGSVACDTSRLCSNAVPASMPMSRKSSSQPGGSRDPAAGWRSVSNAVVRTAPNGASWSTPHPGAGRISGPVDR